MSKIFICQELNDRTFKKAIDKECGAVLFINQTIDIPANIGITFINANSFARDSYAELFDSKKKLLEEFKKRSPDFFIYKDIPLLESINKELFWKTRYEGILKYALHQCEKKNNVVLYDKPSFSQIMRMLKLLYVFVLHVKGFFTMRKKIYSTDSKLKGKKYGFYITGDFQYEYSKNIVSEFGEENCIFFTNRYSDFRPHFKNVDENNLVFDKYNYVGNKFSLRSIFIGLKLFNINTFLLLLDIRKELINRAEATLSNFNSDVKVFFLIAQENTGFGNIIALLGKRYGKLIVNSHNGVKAPDAYNRDNHFDIWCCWDEEMKKLLHEKCFIEQQQLVVTGHVMEDFAAKATYQKSFDGFYRSDGKQKIISLFSVDENPSGKWNVVNALIKFVTEREDLQLIIRLHPSEKQSYWQKVFMEIDQSKIFIIRPEIDDYKKSLYDQLLISDAAVVFGSTVAIECTWFGVPCITYEENPTSMIHSVDSKTIFHERTIESLLNILPELLSKTKDKQIRNETVAQRIKKIINKYIEQ